jgi:hypothetical protein
VNGLWIVPTVWAGLFAFLWGAAWLERVITPWARDLEPSGPTVGDTELIVTAARPGAVGIDGLLAVGVGGKSA